MKYLIVLVVVIVAIGIWRNRRSSEAAPANDRNAANGAARGTALAPPQDMLACAHCGVHIPRSDALLLGQHAYCSADHRQRGPA